MKEEKSAFSDALNGVRTVVFDLDGTLYDKRGLAQRMVTRLWWCLPILAAERLARKNMHYVQFESEEEFFDAFFAYMARGHWWNSMIAATWYVDVYMPTMVRLIKKYHKPRPEVLALIKECKSRGLQMAVYSDYGLVIDKLEALGVDPDLFEIKVAAPTFGALKPAEQCTRKLLELLNANPKTTLFVGDRDEKDGESARAVGAKFYLIKDGK